MKRLVLSIASSLAAHSGVDPLIPHARKFRFAVLTVGACVWLALSTA